MIEKDNIVCGQQLLDELEEILYVSDVETYELLYINRDGQRALGIQEDYRGKKCYQLIQNQDAPCEFCTNSRLMTEEYYVWEHTNPLSQRHYLLKDKLIPWEGRLVRLELAIDITDKENTSKAVQNKLKIEHTLLECIRILSVENSLDQAVNLVLSSIGEFHRADRAYIFEFSEDGKWISNTYEWCAENVEPQIDSLQNLPMSSIDHWMRHFGKREMVLIENVDQLKDVRQEEYEILKPQKVQSLISAPLILDGKVSGFIGVDNPRCEMRDSALLDSLSYFLITNLQERRMSQQLNYMSYHDALTGLYNRNRYIAFLKDEKAAELDSIGVVFVDINGLKRINDQCGHEAGDWFISGLGKILQTHFKGNDIYRIGGDEFVVFCENVSRSSFEALLTNLRQDVDRREQYNVSIGHIWTDGEIDLNALIQGADHRMYEDKQNFYQGIINGMVRHSERVRELEQDWPEGEGERKRRVLQLGLAAGEHFDEIYEINLTRDTIRRVNGVSGRLLECPDSQSYTEAIAYIHLNLVHPDDRSVFQQSFGKAQVQSCFADGDEMLTIQYRRLDQGGKHIWVSASFKRIHYPVEFEDAEDMTLLLMVKNVDSLVREQEQARITEYKYYHALQQACCMICDVDIASDTYQVTVNEDAALAGPESGIYSLHVERVGQNSLHPDDQELWYQNMRLPNLLRMFLEGGQTEVSFDYRTRDEEGNYLWRSNHAVYLAGDGVLSDSILIITYDVEEKKRAERLALNNEFLQKEVRHQQELRNRDARYRIIVEQTGAGVFEWNRDPEMLSVPVDGDRQGSIYISDELRKRFRFQESEGDFLCFLLNREVVHEGDREAFRKFIFDHGPGEDREITCRLLSEGVEFRWFRISMTAVLDSSGERERIIGAVMDVDQEKRAHDEMRRKAEQDALTGILNQEAFYARADQLLFQFPQRSYAIVMMDIDRFKVINDLYGMDGGNRALHQIAEVLSASVGNQGICCRMYADVFYLMSPCDSRKEAEAQIMEILRQLGTGEFGSALTPYFGVCPVEDRSLSAVQLCEMAGFAHKAAKESRQRRVMFYDDTMREELLKEKRIEDEMKLALPNGQFLVFLQPKYDLKENRVTGAEALVRWNHPEEGVISPDRFIPLFEKNGSIIELDLYVWEAVCKAIRGWLDQGLEALPVSVNVSRLHLRGYELEHDIMQLMRKYQIPHRLLELELTESLFFDNMDHLKDVLSLLRSTGFVLNMDDFGSGYSSLNMLKNIQVDTLKIDSEFFNETIATERGKTVIRYTVAMARELSMRIVAEGVETEEQKEFLKEIGCDEIQGYYFSRPIPLKEFEERYLKK